MSTEQEGFRRGVEFFEERNWTVRDVRKLGEEYSGCDLGVSRGLETYRVEVKGTKGVYQGIPDLYGSEVDENGHLIGDFMLLVLMPEGRHERFALISRSDFPDDAFQQKIG